MTNPAPPAEPVQTLAPTSRWKAYALVDSGHLHKLERFGPHVLWRPEPQALWVPSQPVDAWARQASARFERAGQGGGGGAAAAGGPDKGQWRLSKGVPDRWWIDYPLAEGVLMPLKVSLSSFRHVGIFPEQAPNWDFIYERTRAMGGRVGGAAPRVLNLFAYTGAASLAAALGGAQVTHVDSIKQTVSWARENALAARVETIRWMVEDALRFVQRERRRGAQYQGLILDPPAYGRGPEGERWTLEEGLIPLLEACQALLDPAGSFVVLNLYSLGYSPYIGRAVGRQFLMPRQGIEQAGELVIGDQLPLGTYWRAWTP